MRSKHRRSLQKRALKRDGKCVYCGISLTRVKAQVRDGIGPRLLTLDHWVPQVMGGPSQIYNIVASCYPCNMKKGGELPPDFWWTEDYLRMV